MNEEKHPLNILILGIKWPPETFIERKIEGLIKKGYHISVAIGSSRCDSNYIVPGVSVIYLPRWDDPLLNRLFIFLFAFVFLLVTQKNGLKKFLQLLSVSKSKSIRTRFNFLLKSLVLLKENPTTVHFEWNSTAIEYQHLVKIWDCANVISCRGGQINIRPHLSDQTGYLEGLKVSFKKANVVHCVSEAIKKEAEQYGLYSEKARVIYPAVDPGFFKPVQNFEKDDKLKLITTGSLIWRKGYENLLQAVKILQDWKIDFDLNIIGEGEELQRVLFTIADLNLAGRVNLQGQLKPSAVLHALQHADVFVLSSLSEGVSNAVLEAMSCGLPVVTTDCGGMREAVQDGVEGFVVPVRDPESMAEALQKLALDPALRKSMGRAGRERVLAEFNSQTQIEAFVKLFESVRLNETN